MDPAVNIRPVPEGGRGGTGRGGVQERTHDDAARPRFVPRRRFVRSCRPPFRFGQPPTESGGGADDDVSLGAQGSATGCARHGCVQQHTDSVLVPGVSLVTRSALPSPVQVAQRYRPRMAPRWETSCSGPGKAAVRWPGQQAEQQHGDKAVGVPRTVCRPPNGPVQPPRESTQRSASVVPRQTGSVRPVCARQHAQPPPFSTCKSSPRAHARGPLYTFWVSSVEWSRWRGGVGAWVVTPSVLPPLTQDRYAYSSRDAGAAAHERPGRGWRRFELQPSMMARGQP